MTEERDAQPRKELLQILVAESGMTIEERARQELNVLCSIEVNDSDSTTLERE